MQACGQLSDRQRESFFGTIEQIIDGKEGTVRARVDRDLQLADGTERVACVSAERAAATAKTEAAATSRDRTKLTL